MHSFPAEPPLAIFKTPMGVCFSHCSIGPRAEFDRRVNGACTESCRSVEGLMEYFKLNIGPRGEVPLKAEQESRGLTRPGISRPINLLIPLNLQMLIKDCSDITRRSVCRRIYDFTIQIKQYKPGDTIHHKEPDNF